MLVRREGVEAIGAGAEGVGGVKAVEHPVILFDLGSVLWDIDTLPKPT